MSKQNKSAAEENCQCFAKASRKGCPPIKNVTHPLRYYEFTQDELKALEECDKESFYQRCLPFSTLFASLTYAAIKFGFVKRDPNFGVVPKTVLSALLGHVCGRLSYIGECDQKLRQKLPAPSHLGQTMRKYYNQSNPPPEKNYDEQ